MGSLSCAYPNRTMHSSSECGWLYRCLFVCVCVCVVFSQQSSSIRFANWTSFIHVVRHIFFSPFSLLNDRPRSPLKHGLHISNMHEAKWNGIIELQIVASVLVIIAHLFVCTIIYLNWTHSYNRTHKNRYLIGWHFSSWSWLLSSQWSRFFLKMMPFTCNAESKMWNLVDCHKFKSVKAQFCKKSIDQLWTKKNCNLLTDWHIVYSLPTCTKVQSDIFHLIQQ